MQKTKFKTERKAEGTVKASQPEPGTWQGQGAVSLGAYTMQGTLSLPWTWNKRIAKSQNACLWEKVCFPKAKAMGIHRSLLLTN